MAKTLPADVLMEIFKHCLPEHPFDYNEVQPNTATAPILLCHVCSSWREITLSLPSLWSHLHCRLRIQWDKSGHAGQAVIWDSERLRRDMEFMKWWRKNQGILAPSIRLTFEKKPKDSTSEETPLTEDHIQFFIDYLSPAQCLDVGQFTIHLFRNKADGSCVQLPNIQSLITRYPHVAYPEDNGEIWTDDEDCSEGELGYIPGDQNLDMFEVGDDAESSGSDDMDNDGADDHDGSDDDDDRDDDDSDDGNNDDSDAAADSPDSPPLYMQFDGFGGPFLSKGPGGDDLRPVEESDEFWDVELASEEEDNKLYRYPQRRALAPFIIPLTLRHLCVYHLALSSQCTSFAGWSGITHISLEDVFMLPTVWCILIIALPNLQWANISVELEGMIHDAVEEEPSLPLPKSALSALSTLSVHLDYTEPLYSDDGREVDQFKELFQNLYFPSLADLSLYIYANPAKVQTNIDRLNSTLESMPVLTKLKLGFFFPRGGNTVEVTGTGSLQDTEKLSAHAPLVTHVVLDMAYFPKSFPTDKKELSKRLARTLSNRLLYWQNFICTGWVDAASPTSNVQKITAVVKKPIRDGPSVEACIRGSFGDLRSGKDVQFEIVAEDRWGLSPSSVGWRTWGD